ncbi:Rieske (2Fe-2S) protein [Gluconacetobacter azotocaptans]|uniref:Rieske (2Fe-2S) protein n=1 Tax=Gluconacetobacter azotocaptans TaxID=142834 RepID=A0A7W4PH10_9PROT|nr:Rieske (2Fe-2S) protein [Gluconacetobacter azotocaptans]MBB2190591.1 Rieske (2Fe-2S) protein [Gluconacetobacter azotocaptans]GBQ26789.1 Rieske 2Fe-2S domain-containing protein [Gluconacetobacter azotocaptans DSM 13594]
MAERVQPAHGGAPAGETGEGATRGDGWYPLMLSMDLEPGTVAGCTVLGRDLAVWRDADGRAHVWDDRCPHRGMRFSLGVVRAGALACLYHGWRFGPDGRCAHIPAHPDLSPPATLRAAPLVAAEQDGLVWVALGDTPAHGPATGVAGQCVPVRSLAIGAPARQVAQAIGLPAGSRAGGLDRDIDGLVLAAVLPVDRARCMLHLLVAGPGGADADRDRRRRVAAWGQDLRDRVEGAEAAA